MPDFAYPPWESDGRKLHMRLGYPHCSSLPLLAGTRLFLQVKGESRLLPWDEVESNHPHGDFQSPALPTELSSLKWRLCQESNLNLQRDRPVCCILESTAITPHSQKHIVDSNHLESHRRQILLECICSWCELRNSHILTHNSLVFSYAFFFAMCHIFSDYDGTRTRDLLRDRQAW